MSVDGDGINKHNLDELLNVVRSFKKEDLLILSQTVKDCLKRQDATQRLREESPLEMFSRDGGFRDAILPHLSSADVFRLAAASKSLRAIWKPHVESGSDTDYHSFCCSFDHRQRQAFKSSSKESQSLGSFDSPRPLNLRLPHGTAAPQGSAPDLNPTLLFLRCLFPLNMHPTVRNVIHVSGIESGATLMSVRLRGSSIDSNVLFAPCRLVDASKGDTKTQQIWNNSSEDWGEGAPTHVIGYIDPLSPPYFFDPQRIIMESLKPAMAPDGRIFAFRGLFQENNHISNYKETSFFDPNTATFGVTDIVIHGYPLLLPATSFGQIIMEEEHDFFSREMKKIHISPYETLGAGRGIIFTNSLFIRDGLDIPNGATVLKRGRLYWLTDFSTFNIPLPTIPEYFSCLLGTETLVYEKKSGLLLVCGGVSKLSGRRRAEVFSLNLREIVVDAKRRSNGDLSKVNQIMQAEWLERIQGACTWVGDGAYARNMTRVYENGPCFGRWTFLGLLQNPRSDAVGAVTCAGDTGVPLVFLLGGKGKTTVKTPLFECFSLQRTKSGGVKMTPEAPPPRMVPSCAPWASWQAWKYA